MIFFEQLVAVASVLALAVAGLRDVAMGRFIYLALALSAGFYLLVPFAFPVESSISQLADDCLAVGLGMHATFLALVAIVAMSDPDRGRRLKGLKFPMLDRVLERHFFLVGVATAICHVAIERIWGGTFYTGAAVANSTSPMIAFASTALLGVVGASLAYAARRHLHVHSVVLSLTLVAIAGVNTVALQRADAIEPLLILIVALGAGYRQRLTLAVGSLSLLSLLVLSPAMTALRWERAGKSSTEVAFELRNASGGGSLREYGADLAKRSDLLYVSSRLAPLLDSIEKPGVTFYASTLLQTIPRSLYKDKPYLLTSNGKESGNLTLIAWRTLVGRGKGSLSAFGALTAYWQGGWGMVMVDAVLLGLLLRFLVGRLGAGGFFAQAVFLSLLSSFCIRRAPPSFWEGVASLVPSLHFIALAVLIEGCVRSNNGPTHPRESSLIPVTTTSAGPGGGVTRAASVSKSQW